MASDRRPGDDPAPHVGVTRPIVNAATKAVRWAAFLVASGSLAVVTVIGAWSYIGPRAARLRRAWDARVAVEGSSMEPALEPGDWLLVDPDPYRQRLPTPGELVLAPDPREPERLLIKRVASIDADGQLELRGDAPDASTDSRVFGSIDPSTVRGRPWFRYWPIGRIGRIA